MKACLCRLFGALTLLAVCVLWIPFNAIAAPGDVLYPGQAWMSVGEKGPNGIQIKVWTQQGPGKAFSEGEAIAVNFETSHNAYVMAMNVSPKGDVIGPFPNRDSPDNFVEAGKTYSLFGSNSGIRLTPKLAIKESVIIFFVASKQFDLNPLKATETDPFIKIPHTDVAGLGILARKLEEISNDEGFNRETLVLKSASSSPVLKGLMGPKSVKPRGVNGSQGAKGNDKAPGKE